MTTHIGIDVGGTFTDAIAVVDGDRVRGKAFSTADVTTGIVNALGALGQASNRTVSALLSDTERFVLGSTIVTNAVDELRLSRVGLLTTSGFEDTLRIARSARGGTADTHRIVPYPTIAQRRDIRGVDERIDSEGRVITPLDPQQVRNVAGELIDGGVAAIAVCLLWSPRNAAHEEAVAAVLDEHFPDMPYSLSSRLTPIYREYERMVTTVLDAGVKPIVARHFGEVAERLAELGLREAVRVMQVHGGFLSVEETTRAPINIFNSGPVGGVTGARVIAEQLGVERIVTADMGGTSLDAAAIIGGKIRVLPRARIGEFHTSLTAVDIESIGAGGGSIAWIDNRGLMRVGPHSAGSTPGPVCYGKGGQDPTVTDATLTMGLINPDYYLAGTVELDAPAARRAIEEKLARLLGLDAEQAAHGVYRLAVNEMANAIRKITINRGLDPREFTMVAFGGACGLFATAIAAEIGILDVVVPASAAVFSAHGLLYADAVHSEVRTTPWIVGTDSTEIEQAYVDLERRAAQWFDSEAIPEDRRHVVREADVKFVGQIFEVTTQLPSGALTADVQQAVLARFVEDYETEFGTGTAWTEADVQVINIRVKATGRTDRPELTEEPAAGGAHRETYRRDIIDPVTGRYGPVTVLRGRPATGTVSGPCVIEEPDTTIYLPAGAVATSLPNGDLRIHLDPQAIAAAVNQAELTTTGATR